MEMITQKSRDEIISEITKVKEGLYRRAHQNSAKGYC